MEETRIEKNVKTSSAVWLGAANAGTGLLCAFAEGAAFQYLFVNKLGLDVKLNMVVWILFGIWNAVNDPIYGFLADRTKSKLGRRIPWIRYGSPILAVIYALIWIIFPGTEGNQIFLFFQELIGLFLFDILYTAIASAIYVMPYEMAVTNKARNKIFLFNILFSLINFGAPMVLNSQLDKLIEYHADIFPLIMAAMGLVCGAVVFISTFFYKEKVTTESDKNENIFKAVIDCFKNRSFVVFEVLSFTVVFIQTILMQGVIYYFDEFDLPMPVAYGALGLGAVLGVILWATKVRTWGVKKCVFIMCVIFACGSAAMAIFGKISVIAVLGFFTAGMGFAGGMYLVPLMNGDVIDYDESITGLRREGMYAGVNSLITKPAISFANSAFLLIAKAFGYDTTLASGMQSEWAKQGVLVAWMAVPAALLIICAVSLKFYPLAGEKWDETKRALEEKHRD